jgi:hypothetical protein
MKLVDILARDLKEWPENCTAGYCVQAHSGTEIFFGGPAKSLMVSEVADDRSDAKVTRAQWQAAVDALKVMTKVVVAECKSAVKPWTGEDMPPVGALCEIAYGGSDWFPASIRYIGSVYLITGKDDGRDEQHYYLRDVKFRPIRTPEQIATEEKGKTVTDMLCIVTSSVLEGRGVSVQLEALYDAGYRKFEIVEG